MEHDASKDRHVRHQLARQMGTGLLLLCTGIGIGLFAKAEMWIAAVGWLLSAAFFLWSLYSSSKVLFWLGRSSGLGEAHGMVEHALRHMVEGLRAAGLDVRLDMLPQFEDIAAAAWQNEED